MLASDLFSFLREDHIAFQKFLEREKVSGFSLQNKPNWKKFFFLMEVWHHFLEEKILFPQLIEQNTWGGAGLNCGNYFTARVLDDAFWKDSFWELHQLMKQKVPDLTLISASSAELVRRSAMLSVPLEDHGLGSLAAKLILQEENQDQFRIYCEKYSSFLFCHIDREDNCLIPRAQQCLKELPKTMNISELPISYEKRMEIIQILSD